MREHHVPVGDASIYAAETGDPDGRPFLFLHGWPESSRTWADLTAHAGDGIRAVAIDLPGVGASTGTGIGGTVWHFALHTADALPEALVRGRERVYFDYFYDLLAADPATIRDETREAFAHAYATDDALTAGFGWYRAFAGDAEDNQKPAPVRPMIPLLYLRGSAERGGDIGEYTQGLRDTGLPKVLSAVIPGAGHFPQHEAPEETWLNIARFTELPPWSGT